MDNHTIEGDALNEYGVAANHEDCGNHYMQTIKCSGHMLYWENPNTGNPRLLCEAHADESERRQNLIHSEYLNDTVND